MNPFGYSTLAAFAVPALLAGSLVGLVAICAALGRSHWFFRAAAVEAVAIVWLLIPAPELVLMFFVESAVIVIGLKAIVCWRGRAGDNRDCGTAVESQARWQYGIRDLLLLTALVAVALSATGALPAAVLTERIQYSYINGSGAFATASLPEKWIIYSLIGVALGLVALTAVWMAGGRARWWWRVAAALVIPAAPMALWLALLRRLRDTRNKRRWPAAIALVMVSLILFVPTAAIFLKLAIRSPIPPTTLPAPNAYPELVAVARRANASMSSFDPDAPAPQLAAAMAGGGQALIDEVRPLLRRESQVTLTYTWADLNMDGMSGFRTLCRLFVASARLAERDGDRDAAVDACLDGIRLGHASHHGGFLVDLLVGLGIESIAHEELKRLITSLDDRQCRRLTDELSRWCDAWDPLDEVWNRDRIWGQHACTWSERLPSTVWEDLLGIEYESSFPAMQQCVVRRTTRLEILFCACALRRYQLCHECLPERLEELTPEFLASVPIDPLNGAPLFYERDGEGYLLYSTAIFPGSSFGPPEKLDENLESADEELPAEDGDASAVAP